MRRKNSISLITIMFIILGIFLLLGIFILGTVNTAVRPLLTTLTKGYMFLVLLYLMTNLFLELRKRYQGNQN